MLLDSFIDPPGPPEAPTITDIYKTSAVINWQPPLNDGGSPVIGYHLERKMTSSTRWAKVNKAIITELNFKDDDLSEGMEYEYRVMAENKAGVGPPSSPSKPFKAKDPWGEFDKIMFRVVYATGIYVIVTQSSESA
jgi:titin